MIATTNPAPAEFSKGSLPVKKSLVEVLSIDPADLKNDQFQSEWPWLGKRVLLALAPIWFCIGVAATLAWLSYGGAARETIAGSFPQLGWLAPQAAPVAQNTPDMIAPAASAAPSPDRQQLNAMSLDLDAVRQRVDGIAITQGQITHRVDDLTAGQERMARGIDRIAASQEQMMREIAKLQEIEQYIRYKNSPPPPRLAPAPARNPVPRSSQAPTVR